MTQKSTWDR